MPLTCASYGPRVRSRSVECRAAADEPLVLIADDDPNIAPLVDVALKPFHFRTDAVASGAAALVRLRARSYDLLVLDLGMADVDGFDVLRNLRDQPDYERVPVLILSGNSSDDALARSFGYGADEFIKKPFDLFDLGVRAFRLARPFRGW